MADAPKLLFMCTGNICRSPMAMALARGYAQQRGRELEAQSCGMLDLSPQPADPKARAVVAELGLDLEDHTARQLNRELAEWADWILVMEFQHAAWVRERFPAAAQKVFMLGSIGGTLEVADPIGGWKGRFRKSRDEIKRYVELFIDRLPIV